jgi:hypothetical protein
MATDAHNRYRELAYRSNDGVEVVLFWQEHTDELTVTVSDQRSGGYFELDAAPHQALDIFNHPYAHAAFRALPYAEESLTSWAQAPTAHLFTKRTQDSTR